MKKQSGFRRLFGAKPVSEVPAPLIQLSQAMTDVARERFRQINEEGWDEAHDDQHANASLIFAANSYSFNAINPAGKTAPPPPAWPWDKKWWKPSSPRRDLVKAAALLIAEIDRLDRMEARKKPKEG